MKSTICRDCGSYAPKGGGPCEACGGTEFITCHTKKVPGGYDCDETKCPETSLPSCEYAKAWARRARDLAQGLFTTREVADRLQVSVETVRDWIAKGELPAIDLGGRTGYRVRVSDLETFLDARTDARTNSTED